MLRFKSQRMYNPETNSDLSPSLNESPGAVSSLSTEAGLRVGLFAMKGNNFYFQHDNTAHEDDKILDLRADLHYEGYGIFWALLEILHQNGGRMQMHTKRLAFALQVDEEILSKVIKNYDLFVIEDGYFYSQRLLNQIDYRAEIVEKRRKAGAKGGMVKASAKHLPSNELPKERKGKETKEKESIGNNITRDNFEKIKDRLINQSEQEKMNMIKAIDTTYPKANIKFIDTMINLFMDFLLAGDDLYKQPGEYRPYFRNWLLKKVQVDRAAVDKIYRDSFPKREEVEEKWEGIREIDVKEYMKKIKTTPQGGGKI